MDFISFSQFIIDSQYLFAFLTFLMLVAVFVFRPTILKNYGLIVLSTIAITVSSMFTFFSIVEIADEQYVLVSKLDCVSENYSTPNSIKNFFNNKDSELTHLEYLNIQVIEMRCQSENNPILSKEHIETNSAIATQKAKAKLLSL